MKNTFIIGAAVLLIGSCQMNETKKTNTNSTPLTKKKKEKAKKEACTDSCCDTGKNETVLACKLTSPELRKRKETILASLRKQVVKKKELPNGYAFTFVGTDKMIDELTEFVKTERQCCDFFTFGITVKGDKSETVLEITGVEGTKEFITSELEL